MDRSDEKGRSRVETREEDDISLWEIRSPVSHFWEQDSLRLA